jgi:hypothetical protein
MNLMQLPMNLAGSDPLFWLKLGIAQTLPVIGLGLAGLTSHSACRTRSAPARRPWWFHSISCASR